jgi:hypothetical protein
MRVVKALASKTVIGPTPDSPATRRRQNSSREFPRGVTAPMPVTTTRRLLKTPHSYGRDPSQPLPKKSRVKALAAILAVLALSAALTLGASAQQQTFSTAHAGPTGPVPVITGQPVNGDYYGGGYYPYPCNGSSGQRRPVTNPNPNPRNGGSRSSSHMAQNGRYPCNGTRPSARPSARPSHRPPGPHPTHLPAPAPT